MFPTSSLNTELGDSSDTLVTEFENPGLRGDKPATTCVSHCAALGIIQWAEIIIIITIIVIIIIIIIIVIIFNKSGASCGLEDVDSKQPDR